MATAQVEQPVPAAVHDGSCFQEEENQKLIPVQDDVPATEVEEEAPGAEEVQVQVHADGVSNEDALPKGHQEEEDYYSKEINPKDHRHEDEDEAAITTDEDRLMQSVAREVEVKLKLGIVQGDVESAAATADDEPKLPNKEAPAERRPKVAMKAAAAKAVVVPVDDDDDDLVDAEAVVAPAEAAPREAPEEEDAGADKGEELQEETKAHEE